MKMKVTIFLILEPVFLTLFSSLAAVLFAYLGLEEWLTHYAFCIGIGWWLIVSPMLIVMTVAMISVSIQSLKAAFVNLVASLRHG